MSSEGHDTDTQTDSADSQKRPCLVFSVLRFVTKVGGEQSLSVCGTKGEFVLLQTADE